MTYIQGNETSWIFIQCHANLYNHEKTTLNYHLHVTLCNLDHAFSSLLCRSKVASDLASYHSIRALGLALAPATSDSIRTERVTQIKGGTASHIQGHQKGEGAQSNSSTSLPYLTRSTPPKRHSSTSFGLCQPLSSSIRNSGRETLCYQRPYRHVWSQLMLCSTNALAQLQASHVLD